MFNESKHRIRASLTETFAALNAVNLATSFQGSDQASMPGSNTGVDYQAVHDYLEREARAALSIAAAELRKPTLRDLTERLWNAGAQTFVQIQAVVADSGVASGDVEAILNRLRNAGLLETTGAIEPPLASPTDDAATASPESGAAVDAAIGETTLNFSATSASAGAGAENADVTQVRSKLITTHGRDWFDKLALSQGIDLSERINCQF